MPFGAHDTIWYMHAAKKPCTVWRIRHRTEERICDGVFPGDLFPGFSAVDGVILASSACAELRF
jgi:hypothetical protein